MQWMISLETEDDPIPACRLLNVFRRKGVKIETLNLSAGASGFSLMAVVVTPDGEFEHIYNFLRRTEGVRHVSCYRHEPSADACFIFIDGSEDSSLVDRFTQSFPDSRIVFAGSGKYLFEVFPQPGVHTIVPGIDAARCLPFARVRTTHPAIQAELVGAEAR